MTGKLDQTKLFISIGSTMVVLFVGILIFSVIATRKMLLKKRRKELLRLPTLPRTDSSPYETKFTFSNDPHSNPDYEIVEEEEENYEDLQERREESKTTNDKERMSVESYVDPKHLEVNYQEVVHSSNEKSYENVNPYIELIDDSVESMATRAENESPIDKERMSLASYLDPKNLESIYLEVMQSSKK
ncbi:uncharacterized protein LOC134270189 [Saccostrea cucullata]|uniref:uncharacterized protein LOC134270189 n=1 Tax=Saccostrea cuccullata TaxID=36930 RepID=UPI002ED55216